MKLVPATIFLVPFISLSLVAPAAAAESGYTFELFGGAAYNVPAHLKITQSGERDISLTARYETHAFDSPFYWALRAGRRSGDAAWELELVHDKLYLDNKPSEVQDFAMTHGFNLLTVNRAWERYGLLWRLGAGVVVSHPESTVRGRVHEESGGISGGYHLSGPTAQAAAQKRFPIGKGFFGTIESKLTASWFRIPVQDGHAEGWNFAVHGLFGLGYDSSRR